MATLTPKQRAKIEALTTQAGEGIRISIELDYRLDNYVLYARVVNENVPSYRANYIRTIIIAVTTSHDRAVELHYQATELFAKMVERPPA